MKVSSGATERGISLTHTKQETSEWLVPNITPIQQVLSERWTVHDGDQDVLITDVE